MLVLSIPNNTLLLLNAMPFTKPRGILVLPLTIVPNTNESPVSASILTSLELRPPVDPNISPDWLMAKPAILNWFVCPIMDSSPVSRSRVSSDPGLETLKPVEA